MQKLIEGKKVIFVGPAPNLIDKGLADFIDNFDVVIRTNGAINLLEDENYTKHYGKKTDCLYVNVQFQRDSKGVSIPLLKKHKVKYINFKSISEPKRLEYEKKGIISYNLNALVKYMNTQVESCLMGCIILKHVLDNNPKEFFVTGIDFYETKPDVFIPDDYREYLDGYLLPSTRKWADKNVPLRNNGKDGHNKISNTSYIYNLIKDGKVKTNDFIIESAKNILGENS